MLIGMEQVTEDSASVTTGAGTSISVAIRKRGNVVMLTIINGGFTASAEATLFEIPVGFRPLINIQFLETYGSKRVFLQTDGKFLCAEALSSTPIRGTFVYLCD